MGFLKNCLPMQDRYFTLTKVGNTNTLNTNAYWQSIT